MVLIESYSHEKSYLNFDMQSVEGKDVLFDSNGVPRLNISKRGIYHYYPITIAIFGLEQISKYYKTKDQRKLERVKNVADFLVHTQSIETGAWESDFEYFYAVRETGKLEPGWTSALAQGFCISCLARAFYLFKDNSYLEAVERAVDPFYIESSDGGVLAYIFDKYPWYEEYTTPKKSHILNGFMFSLLGLYDGYMLTGSERYKERFETGLNSLRNCISMFDLKDVSSYDLTHLTIPGNAAKYHVGYHFTHIRLMSALQSIKPDEIIGKVLDRWISYSKGNKSYFRLVERKIHLSTDVGEGFSIIGEDVVATVSYKDPEIEENELEYAFYLIKDGEKYKRTNFSSERRASFKIDDGGEYYIAVYIKDMFENRVGLNSEKFFSFSGVPETKINGIVVDRDENSISVRVSASGHRLTYAFYVYRDGVIYKKFFYDSSSVFSIKPDESGEYQFECFVKSLGMKPVVKRSEKVTFDAPPKCLI